MKTVQVNIDLELFVETCCVCGTKFGIEKSLQDSFKYFGEKKPFSCPNGHIQHYTVSTESKINDLKERLLVEQENTAWWKEEAEQKARSLSATKGVLTRTKNRIAGGVCPCCNRSFVDLARHMHGQHPDYADDKGGER